MPMAGSGSQHAAAASTRAVVLHEFLAFLEDSDVAVAVAVIKALTGVIRRSEATTMMQMESELREAALQLKTWPIDAQQHAQLAQRYMYQTSIAMAAGCELFLRYVTRSFLEFGEFDACKAQLIERGEVFAETSLSSRKRIAQVGHSFVRNGMRVLTHGTSRVVIALLLEAAKTKHFSVFVAEGRSNQMGARTAQRLSEAGIPTTVILDAAVGFYMEQTDLVIVGAEGVVENGGIVNSVGTFSTAIIARAMKKPFYVAAESYKFARLYPLTQRDLPQTHETMWSDDQASAQIQSENVVFESPSYDYTPPDYIALMFTDLGVLTPSAVSDELIKLYQ